MIQIDRQKIYESHGYIFKNFVCLTDEEKQMILKWRNHEKVRNMMVNKDLISLEDHLAFIEGLKNRNDCYYWLVLDPSGVNVGVMDIIHVDYSKDEGEIGYYINPDEAGNGFEFMIECLYFAFGQVMLGNNKVTINVKNKDVLLFNKYLGGSFEKKEIINGETFYINNHGHGEYIIKHYKDFSLLDYARYVRKNKNKDLFFNKEERLEYEENIHSCRDVGKS